MIEQLESLEQKYVELGKQLSDPEIIGNQKEFQKLAKAHSDLEEVVEKYRQYKDITSQMEEAREILEEENDGEMQEMARTELDELSGQAEKLEKELELLLIPTDPYDKKNVIMEIRAGAGGDEAAIFAGDLFRMYSRYAENQKWKVEILSSHESDVGGYKEIIFSIEGKKAYSKMKFESGVHRVQRIPETESGGRIHTSTVTVAVLPEAEDVDVEIDPNEIRVDIFCSSGPGGQSVNTTQSAVRLTHLPTGITVSCQDEKSQHKNKDKAFKILRSRLLEKAQEEAQGEIDQARRSQVGTGDRSERIRTYNFPQNRMTDHRIGFTTHKLELVMSGELDEVISELITRDQAQRLKDVR